MTQKNKATKPTSARGAQPKVQAIVYKHVKTPLFEPGDSDLFGDPYFGTAKVQYVHKVDRTTEIYTVAKCNGQKEYSAGSAGNVHRLLWAAPMIVKQPNQGATSGKTQLDIRGVFADIGVTRVSFKNIMKQPVKIIINSPRGRISDPSTCYLRRFKREINVQPGKTKWFTAQWGDKANIFTPMVTDIDVEPNKERMQTFALCDYAIIIPNIEEMSGKEIKDLADQEAVEVHVQQRYIATAPYDTGSGMDLTSRKPFLVQKLGSIKDMMFESPVVLLGALPSNTLGIRSIAGNSTVFCDDGALSMPELEGRRLVIHGVSGIFKVVKGNIIHWNVDLDQPHGEQLEPICVAPGCPYQVLPEVSKISIKDVIGWLTTATEILSVVASFL